MRRYGLYDTTRGLTLALAAGAGRLAAVPRHTGGAAVDRLASGRRWGSSPAAGLVLALAPVLGGWTSGLRLRLSPGTFLLGFLPVLVVVGWILLATQPGNGWHEGTIVSWSHDIGLMGIVHDLGLWHGVLAFGFGLVLGTCLDAVPAPVAVPVRRAGPTVVVRPHRDCDRSRRAADAEQRRSGVRRRAGARWSVGPHATTNKTQNDWGPVACAAPEPLTQGSCVRTPCRR